jgi:hypothetical protein
VHGCPFCCTAASKRGESGRLGQAAVAEQTATTMVRQQTGRVDGQQVEDQEAQEALVAAAANPVNPQSALMREAGGNADAVNEPASRAPSCSRDCPSAWALCIDTAVTRGELRYV